MHGHSVLRVSYYMQKVPSTWHEDLKGLIHRHRIEFGWTEDGTGVAEGVDSLDFHVFVEDKVKQLDDTYICQNKRYIGKGFAAQNAMKALQAWVDKGELPKRQKPAAPAAETAGAAKADCGPGSCATKNGGSCGCDGCSGCSRCSWRAGAPVQHVQRVQRAWRVQRAAGTARARVQL